MYCALYVLFPVVPAGIAFTTGPLFTFCPSNVINFHPTKLYPVFDTGFNVIASSTVYVDGFDTPEAYEPPSVSNVNVYVFAVLVAVDVTSAFACGIVTVVDCNVESAIVGLPDVCAHAKFEYVYPVTFSKSAEIATDLPHLYVPEPDAFSVFVPAVTVNVYSFLA